MIERYITIGLFMVGQIITAAGTYGAIRADLMEAIVTSHQAAEAAAQANKRIDAFMLDAQKR